MAYQAQSKPTGASVKSSKGMAAAPSTSLAKEFFKAHFFPREHGRLIWFAVSLGYYLAALVFNAFPLPQREAGARQTLCYMGELLDGGCSLLIFPEGHHTDTGEIDRFRPGIGMIASRLAVPVVPVRLEGVDRVLHRTWHMARPGHVRMVFAAPMRLTARITRRWPSGWKTLCAPCRRETSPDVALEWDRLNDYAGAIDSKSARPLIQPRGKVREF